MGHPITVTGIVLNAMPIGENDKRLVLLTKEKGKLTAFAKGARRPKSPLLASSSVFAFGEYTLYQGKSYNSITASNVLETFQGLRNDIEYLSYGLYFNELAEYMSNEEEESSETLRLLYKTLSVLTKQILPISLIRIVFELKMLSIHGLTPEVVSCLHNDQSCNSIRFFSPSEGGVFCDAHGKMAKDAFMISEGSRYTMQYILASPIKAIFSFNVTDEVLFELTQIMKRYIKYHLDHPFKTLSFINLNIKT